MSKQQGFMSRALGLMGVFLVIAGLLICRLAWLQLVNGGNLAATAAKYHSRVVYYRWGRGSEGRGTIYDRRLRPFTEARLQNGLAVFTAIGRSEPGYEDWLQVLTVHTGLEREEIIQRSRLGRPLPLAKALPAGLELPHWLLPVTGEWDSAGDFRRYTYGSLACHVLGFAGPPFAGEDAAAKLIGRLGIEKQYDKLLRCLRPGVAALADAEDRLIPGLGYRNLVEPEQIPNVVLSLDIEIQSLVENILDKFSAAGRIPPGCAVVVLDPNCGDILAMASRPCIDGSANQYNRAARKSPQVAMLPLASLVKVVTAAAALEKDPSLSQARFTCAGRLSLGANTFECTHGPHGEQDLAEAMANSCNLYFAQLAEAVGGQELLAMATAMGLASKPEIGLPASEVSAGHLPQLADLATQAGLANNFAMGGNKVEATPLQAAIMLSSIANGGWRVEARLVLATNQSLNETVKPPAVKRTKIMSAATANAVAELLRHVVVQGKTGYFDGQRYPYAARALALKTGTSDVLPPAGYQVRWCGGFFPWREPEYVVVFMAEAPGANVAVDRGGIVAEIVEAIAQLKQLK